MNIQEAIGNLFNFGNSTEAIVLGVILGLTFLLGIFVWFLLAHLPQRRRLKKDLKILNSELESLDKEHKELVEKYAVQSAKVQRLEEEASKSEILLNEKETKLQQIQQLYTHLESERDKNYSLAEASKRELAELKNFIQIEQGEAQESIEKEAKAKKELQEALAKVEEMKGLMEEMEKERHGSSLAVDVDQAKLNKTERALQESKMEINVLQEELQSVKDQLEILTNAGDNGLVEAQQKLKAELLDLQSELIQMKGEKDEIAEKLIAYQSLEEDVKGLRDENEKLCARLQGQANMEQQLSDTVVDDEVLERMLSETRSVMEGEGFFTEINNSEIIEDELLLNENINKTPTTTETRGLEELKPVLEFDEEELKSMTTALEQAEGAMNLQGFFGAIEEAVLLESEEIQMDDDAKMERALNESAAVFEQSGFFNTINANEIIEDQDLLDLQLQQQPESTARGLGEEENIVAILTELEEEEMNRALSSAESAMNEEGLYGNIDINQQLEINNRPEQTEKVDKVKEEHVPYRTSIEKAVIAEINQLLPSAEGMINDDLKKINGIGALIEEKLNRMGIRTYAQVAQLKEPVFISRLNTVLGLPAGSIERDQWVYQAKQLLTKQKINDLTKDIDLHKLFKK